MFIKTSLFCVIAFFVGCGCPAMGALIYTYSGPAVSIPDNDPGGRAFAFSLSDPATSITSVSVSLNISGGYNGDLYAYLSHGSGFAVLLNRTGVGSAGAGGTDNGYADTGFTITLSAAGANNVHFYQGSSYALNGSGQLTGTWQPDGRAIDPLSASSAFDPAGSATFSSFTGLDPNGSWTLYFEDTAAINESTLNSFTVAVVPEPVPVALPVFFGILAAAKFVARLRARYCW